MRNYSGIELIVMAVAAGLLSPRHAHAQQSAMPALSLTDQFEKPHDIGELRGAVVVVVYGDRQSQEANRQLGEKLHVAFHPTAAGKAPAEAQKAPVRPIPGGPDAPVPDVRIIPVACCGKVPAVVQRIIRGQIKKGAPDVPVWLDFDETMARLYGLKAGQPNLIVFDALGRYRQRLTGTPDAAKFEELVQTLDTLRAEALMPER
jgi:hypothetical protein